MSDYTPTEDDLHLAWTSLQMQALGMLTVHSSPEFDRAIAKIKAEAWQEGWDAGAGWPQDDTNPHKAES